MKTLWQIDIAAPPQEIWQELTRIGTVQRYYFDSVLQGDLEVGGKIRYTTPDSKHTFIEGEVVELLAPSKFAHTFRFTDLDEPQQRVTFELEATEAGTRLKVRHEGLDKAPKHSKRVDPGWTKILGNLKSWVEKGSIPLGSRVAHCVMKIMLPLMPNRQVG